MADSPTKAMMTVVSWATMLGMASGKSTRRMICRGVAPMESAASTMPSGTSFNEVSTCRPINGIEARTSGTMAAVVPMDVPTMTRVNGMIATIKMMNGMERIALTTPAAARFRGMHSKICPLPVVKSRTPSGMPMALATSMETMTM